MGVTAAAALVGAGAAVKGISAVAKAGRAARSCNSFVAGTLVRRADGSLTPIEELEIGDAVLAADPTTGEMTSELIIAPLHGRGEKHLIALVFDSDTSAVMATANHPYWIEGKGWIDAGDLVVGDTTRSSSGAPRALVSVTDLGLIPNQDVYNLHVSGPHTYFVTATNRQCDQLVHNAAACARSLLVTAPQTSRGASRSTIKRQLKKEGWTHRGY